MGGRSGGHGHLRNKVTLPTSDRLHVRIVVDNWSTDIYAGEHGLYHMPITCWSRRRDLELSVQGGTAAFPTLRVHELKSIWKQRLTDHETTMTGEPTP